MRYDISACHYGRLISNYQLILRWTSPRLVTIPAGAVDCECTVEAAPAAPVTITLLKNNVAFGTIGIYTGYLTGTFSIPNTINLINGDVITIIGPPIPDTSLIDVAITIAALA